MEAKTVMYLSWISLGLAVVLLVSPWIFGFAAGAPMTMSLIGAVLIGGSSLLAIALHRNWEAWPIATLLNLIFGALVFISPMLFHYNDNNAVTWIQVLGGIAVFIIATMQMWQLAPSAMPRMAR
jgi:hypothetical protein